VEKPKAHQGGKKTVSVWVQIPHRPTLTVETPRRGASRSKEELRRRIGQLKKGIYEQTAIPTETMYLRTDDDLREGWNDSTWYLSLGLPSGSRGREDERRERQHWSSEENSAEANRRTSTER
jgi:DNA segregation ATPase FtsK/SpoIIIE-like protein